MNALSVRDCFSTGWRTFKARPWIFVQAGLLLLLIHIAINLLQYLLETGAEQMGGAVAALLAVGFAVASILASFLINMGETAFFLRAHDDAKAVGLRDLWHPEPFWKFVGAALLAGLAIFLGFILLIVPGIILSILFMFVGYLAIERRLGPIAALKESTRLTKGSRWKLFQLALLALLLNILGFLALIIGLFVTIPVTLLATVHAYRTLSSTDAVAKIAPEEAPDSDPVLAAA